jgi:hypothetical protein
VSWIAENWRLKLLAVGLSALMLAAVAFSQNPPTIKTIKDVSIAYSVPPGLVVIDPPTSTTVTVRGLADTLTSISNQNVIATVDLSKALPGPTVNANLVAQIPHFPSVTIVNPSVGIVLNVDTMDSITLPVTIRYREAPGWKVTRADAVCGAAPPCKVTYEGPHSWVVGLKAYADFPSLVENNSYDVPTQQVVLVGADNSTLDTTRLTVPRSLLDTGAVTIHIEAKTSTTSRQVALIDAPPAHYPPAPYRITAITIDPVTVVITGPADALVKITIITLPAVDLTGRTSDATFRLQLTYPNGVTGSVRQVTVTYQISRNPNVQPSP